MSNRWGLSVPNAGSGTTPDGFYEWKGYRLPFAVDAFTWEQLVAIAAANGLVVGHALILKWCKWRFLPRPQAGGSTGRGPGKGQLWSHEAGLRAAWLSRWQRGTLSYDALRLAMWPSTPALEAERPREVLVSVRAFFRQDQDFHDRKLGDFGWLEDPLVDDYYAVVLAGESNHEQRVRLLIDAGLPRDDPDFERTAEFLKHLNFPTMRRVFDSIVEDDLRAFMAGFRTRFAGQADKLVDIFWSDPLHLARVVIRELFREKYAVEPSKYA